MYLYRQHPVALLWAAAASLLLGSGGVALSLVTGEWLFVLAFALAAMLLLAWRAAKWTTFTLYVEGRRATLHTLNGFVVNERVVSLNAPGGLKLRQNLAGLLFDYGSLRIEVFNGPVEMAYLAPFSMLKRQIGDS